MFKWIKLGKIFDPSQVHGRAWLKEFAQAPSVLIFDKFVRVYFSCRPQADSAGQYISYSAYVDLNRNNLFEIIDVSDNPILDLGSLGTFDEFGTYPVSVIRNDQAVVAYYGGWTRCESVPFNVSIGCAVSHDEGKNFKKIGAGPVVTFSVDEPFVISGPKVRIYNNMWYLWYIAGKKWKMVNRKAEPIYKIRMAHSADGLNWTKLNRDLVQNKLEEDEAQASPDVFYYNQKYHMFFCYRYSEDYRSKDKGYRIGYASSVNLTDWIRDDSKAGIDVSNDGWDSEMISYPHVFELDSNIYMLYLGNQVGRYGFGLAQLDGALI